jgi:hypothetical protein
LEGSAVPHFPKPFYRAPRKTWFVQVGKKQHPLGKHPDGVPPPKKVKGEWRPVPRDIWEAYHQLTAGPPDAAASAAAGVCPLAVAVLDAFLDWLSKRVAEGNKARRTYDWYRKYLQSFATFAGEGYRVADLTADRLQPIHVYQWVDSHPDWQTGRRGALTAVQRAFTLGSRGGPPEGMRRPLAAGGPGEAAPRPPRAARLRGGVPRGARDHKGPGVPRPGRAGLGDGRPPP